MRGASERCLAVLMKRVLGMGGLIVGALPVFVEYGGLKLLVSFFGRENELSYFEIGGVIMCALPSTDAWSITERNN